jgi:hypothetical protein
MEEKSYQFDHVKIHYTEEDILREDAENNAYKYINDYVRHNPNQYNKPKNDDNTCCCNSCCNDFCKNCDTGSCLIGLFCGFCLFK